MRKHTAYAETGRHVWKMCAKCESEPEPNHPGAGGTRARQSPRSRPVRPSWPTVDLAVACDHSRAGAPRQPPPTGCRAPARRFATAHFKVSGLRRPATGHRRSLRRRPHARVVSPASARGSREADGRALRYERKALAPAGAPPPLRPRSPRRRSSGTAAGGGPGAASTLADNTPRRSPKSKQSFRSGPVRSRPSRLGPTRLGSLRPDLSAGWVRCPPARNAAGRLARSRPGEPAGSWAVDVR